ncbi:formyltransferase family protein [Gammaproteobacteria bacterium]|nr:formyltransferase family protein [Gammaproteobacteria bacterium]
MKIALVGYRKWALDIYDNVSKDSFHEFIRFNSKEDFSEDEIDRFQPDFILFYGWSWIINENLVKNYKCIMLHPSPLPKYRGGSPIQNQIIRGETVGAVTIFLMDSGVDTGPIIAQEEISLLGSLDEIFKRITDVGSKLTSEFISNGYKLKVQDHTHATSFKRRKESDSEISLEEITTKDSTYLVNKIRMLQDPYPNPFIKTIDGKKLIILKVNIEE